MLETLKMRISGGKSAMSRVLNTSFELVLKTHIALKVGAKYLPFQKIPKLSALIIKLHPSKYGCSEELSGVKETYTYTS